MLHHATRQAVLKLSQSRETVLVLSELVVLRETAVVILLDEGGKGGEVVLVTHGEILQQAVGDSILLLIQEGRTERQRQHTGTVLLVGQMTILATVLVGQVTVLLGHMIA